MLRRQSNVSSDAPDGSAGISVVEPPPFFHGVVRQSTARMTFTAGRSSAQARQVELFLPRAIEGEVGAGHGLDPHPRGGAGPYSTVRAVAIHLRTLSHQSQSRGPQT